MRCLFVHQNSPAQYRHVIRELAARPGNEIVVLSQTGDRAMPGARWVQYKPEPPAVVGRLRELDTHLANAEAVRQVALKLRDEGFRPDVMLGHNGWGETFFLKDVWPDVPLVGYFEFFYHPRGSDVDFDPEFPVGPDVGPRLRLRNAGNLIGLNAADWGQTPTQWQAWQYPPLHRARMSVFHEGIDTDVLKPFPGRRLNLPSGKVVAHGDEVITFVSRNLEPYRGFHIFMRALPEILRRRPKAEVLIVGADGVSYGAGLAGGKSYREALLEQVGDRLDLSRVHFLGPLPYEHYQAVLHVSSLHVYLTYPFVLSWSMLEAMACGCLVLGSATPPVMEVIRPGENGLLTDFFNIPQMLDRIDAALNDPQGMAPLRAQARQTVIDHYDLKRVCLPRNLQMIEDLAAGRTPRTYQDQQAGFAPKAVYTVADALQLAWRHFSGGDLTAAENIYRSVLTQKPENTAALFRLGQVLQQRGRTDEAETMMAKACELDPQQQLFQDGLAELRRRRAAP